MEYDIETSKTGTKYYYKKGTKVFHREDGPAVEFNNGDKEWIIDGFFHREDGPAIEENRYRAWLIRGKYHRENGPAIEYADGYKEWWINGKRLSIEKEKLLNNWWDNKNGI